MAAATVAPVLSTASDVILEQGEKPKLHQSQLSNEQLDIQYEIKRTVEQIRARKWKRIALQFPDEMLVDAPNVFDRLRSALREKRLADRVLSKQQDQTPSDYDQDLTANAQIESDAEEKLSILGDTSYGACCVDEIAAEHVDADGVVHYGRSCLSPTQRLSVIYVYTSRQIDIERAIDSLQSTVTDPSQIICILADTSWQTHVGVLTKHLRDRGYKSVITPDVVHNPSSIIPNRALPEASSNADAVRDFTIWHIGKPPTALLLTLTSRVKAIHIYDPATHANTGDSNTSILLRRRYASLLKLSSAAVIGILINTLSVKNYLSALEYAQGLISAAGKKSYTFVVGKLNPPKLANFAEVQGWVVIGCWESSLIDSRDFLAPVVTPYELEVALAKDDSRIWGQEWISDFESLLRRQQSMSAQAVTNASLNSSGEHDDDVEASDEDEPPEFDLRTGRYVSHTRPMQAARASVARDNPPSPDVRASTALVQRYRGELASVNGVTSPGAEFLRSKRNWQGLGSDFEVQYDRNEDGSIQGAAMEQGRCGVAKEYSHPAHVNSGS